MRVRLLREGCLALRRRPLLRLEDCSVLPNLRQEEGCLERRSRRAEVSSVNLSSNSSNKHRNPP